MNRCFVFVDESGDFGFGKSSSRFVTVAAVVTCNPRQLERIPLRIRKRRLKKSILRIAELKFHDSSTTIRKDFLRRVIAVDDARIASITAEKKRVAGRYIGSGDMLYYDLVGELVMGLILHDRSFDSIDIAFDDRPCGSLLGRRFTTYLGVKIDQGCRDMAIIAPNVRLSIFDSMNCRGLQVADFVAGAIRRRYEHGDSTYYDMIATKIAIEKKFP